MKWVYEDVKDIPIDDLPFRGHPSLVSSCGLAGNIVRVIFLHLRKDFDLVHHNRLLNAEPRTLQD